MHTGHCLCGAIRFEVTGDLPAPFACHCGQCRRQSGHVWASTDVPREAVTIHGADQVTWFRASGTASQGFCATCGSFLFWDADGQDTLAIAMGAFDAPTGARLAGHIFTADKGDYYDITDDLPQRAQ